MRLKGKVALVTGGASGIGYAIAERFAIEGANVAIADVDGESAEAAAERLQKIALANISGIAMDVTKEDQVESGVRDVLQRYGGLDVLCSNAGVQHIAGVHELTYSDWKKVTSTHLDGAFLTTRACLRHMYRSGRGGTILYMGSVHSKIASVLKAPYVAAKHGIVGLCRTVAKEGAQYGVRANVICPGFVRTALVEKQIPEQAELLGITAEEVVQKVMLKDAVDGQFTTTDEIAEAAVFLAQQRTLALTGQSIIVSHGWVME
ncbi:3-hydroxybutyrate dehydrogenase [Terriglobus albidus]|uniref:3-hydroxybutyrate dehydrogenase n=1 Tax=Terriglobus albidus TaxID=1592106 RepID=A0A5B9E9N5_9BACT|nr:3-hydroxybutyrate dehydrogenase [Terriglobus albidus]QEE28933.1 3-hydroxybutyrate dehydrogenase [Terriglobus albidus]